LIKRWLDRHPRFHLHFTPTSGSWLNMVERCFAELTNKKIKRGAHRSVRELERDIREWGWGRLSLAAARGLTSAVGAIRATLATDAEDAVPRSAPWADEAELEASWAG
jgi:hypothetical protein